MREITVVTPTLMRPELEKALESVRAQTLPCEHVIWLDGKCHPNEYQVARFRYEKDEYNTRIAYWPYPVGGGTWYANRIIAAAPFLVTTPYIAYLNDDDWWHPDHLHSLYALIRNYDLDWSYSHRKVYDHDGNYLLDDNCEALGESHDVWNVPGHRFVDTCAILMKTHVAQAMSHCYMSNQFGRDRVAYAFIKAHFPKFMGSKLKTMNFRLGSNQNSAVIDYFRNGNRHMQQLYGETMPWE
jgi:glycosyltransferase involved in cell wall biosynthesis